jgi:hypothetical protein
MQPIPSAAAVFPASRAWREVRPPAPAEAELGRDLQQLDITGLLEPAALIRHG